MMMMMMLGWLATVRTKAVPTSVRYLGALDLPGPKGLEVILCPSDIC